jgi:CheY-like chemotaxis protein
MSNTVLLIDDEEVLNLIHEKLFKRTGFSHTVFTYSNGKCAIEFLNNIVKLENYPKELMPSYIFLDIDMPIMDGNQFFAEFIKLYESKKIDLPKVIVLTSALKPETIFDKLGIDIKFSKKPLTEAMLNELISMLS